MNLFRAILKDRSLKPMLSFVLFVLVLVLLYLVYDRTLREGVFGRRRAFSPMQNDNAADLAAMNKKIKEENRLYREHAAKAKARHLELLARPLPSIPHQPLSHQNRIYSDIYDNLLKFGPKKNPAYSVLQTPVRSTSSTSSVFEPPPPPPRASASAYETPPPPPPRASEQPPPPGASQYEQSRPIASAYEQPGQTSSAYEKPFTRSTSSTSGTSGYSSGYEEPRMMLQRTSSVV